MNSKIFHLQYGTVFTSPILTNMLCIFCILKRNLRETQADSSIHAVSIDPGVRAPLTWYSPTKGIGKIGEHGISRIFRSMHVYG
ncbi:thioredoxin-like protein [Rhizophagus irregularis DAOM 181602=DAOM 197198]|nr:thioredoxin-like protein [Rhizophagus irregularis DAOM 181602=DAOM 197198]